MRPRPFQRGKTMLAEYQEPAMEEAQREELEAFVAKRKEELPDAWY